MSQNWGKGNDESEIGLTTCNCLRSLLVQDENTHKTAADMEWDTRSSFNDSGSDQNSSSKDNADTTMCESGKGKTTLAGMSSRNVLCVVMSDMSPVCSCRNAFKGENDCVYALCNNCHAAGCKPKQRRRTGGNGDDNDSSRK